MSKTHKSYRLDTDLLEAVDAYAEGRGVKSSEAVADLLRRGLAGGGAVEGAPGDEIEALRGNVADLRGEVATLKEQLERKDEQISGLMALAGNAQTLQAAEARRALGDGAAALEVDAEADDGPQEAAGAPRDGDSDPVAPETPEPANGAVGDAGTPPRRTWRERLAAWLLG